MSIDEYFDKMKNIQRVFLEYIEDESNVEENYENFVKILKDEQILKDCHKLKELLHLINNVGNNHRRFTNFLYKIEQILQHLKNEILNFFSNTEIFELFEDNKRLLLFLIEEKIITIDEYIVSQITNNKYAAFGYPEYFAPEIKPFITKEFIDKYNTKNTCLGKDNFINEITKEHQEKNFFDKRKTGENDDCLCELIRLKQTEDFIEHIKKVDLTNDGYIQQSIFETNPLLNQNKKIKIIEYAAFFESIEIVKYMHENGSELTPEMFIYAVHSQNEELIKYLEENKISPPENNYESILEETIKCHHNDLSRYFIENRITDEELQSNIENKFNENINRYSFKYHNYCFFPKNINNKFIFYYLCEFDYFTFVKLYLTNMNIDVNETIILKQLIF